MAISELRLIKKSWEYLSRDSEDVLRNIPRHTRGIYALYKQQIPVNGKIPYDLVYVGMARGVTLGVTGRLNVHMREKDLWTHFSVFEVWDNIQDDEIEELEGLFRHLYRYDTKANSMNTQKGYKKLIRIAKQTKEGMSEDP